jgi:hypothetical protein
MEHSNKLMELIDKVSPLIPEGDYIQMCDILKSLRESLMSRPPPLIYEPVVLSLYIPDIPPYEPMDRESSA